MSADDTHGPAGRETQYVAGFMFQDDRVALIVKLRPAWQSGRLNGIGGHIEAGESAIAAMVREFHQETGCLTCPEQWHKFVVLKGAGWQVAFFWAEGDLAALSSPTLEPVCKVPIRAVDVSTCLPDLTWLIPMARSMRHGRAKWFFVSEVPS